ncbi:MAG: hypothetical protein COX80_02790 [Candidatus Magasanikbacteria bacterium CG_4_10_14_0_2_um_filter_33_14]|uniref:Uncharacterized protein n=1 Tax=Candidatus Magasanikbacteria bacterium CG_4_10_14_0_2_um_filter_33_14 TaxID=1974636 RepID=A0A2M7VAI8_9BACT|nr:MAG: hypothetical protein COX80_02790 [Candidatus Magasanikbacteria bacterium CG_4_10_14_0_2_um_filter_33_14]
MIENNHSKQNGLERITGTSGATSDLDRSSLREEADMRYQTRADVLVANTVYKAEKRAANKKEEEQKRKEKIEKEVDKNATLANIKAEISAMSKQAKIERKMQIPPPIPENSK